LLKPRTVARRFKHQYMEVEHVLIALLEQEEGLAHKFSKGQLDSDLLLQELETFAKRQARCGPAMTTICTWAKASIACWTGRGQSRQTLEDKFISVEHLLLGFQEDERIGRRCCGALRWKAQLMAAVQAVRGSQSVTDQNPRAAVRGPRKVWPGPHPAGPRGPLDPVIGRMRKFAG
jgi:ATP-dependent Clp protease ATP-binding subunit ClpB